MQCIKGKFLNPFHISNIVPLEEDMKKHCKVHVYSEAIKASQFLVSNTGSHINGCIELFLLSFCQMASFTKHKRKLFCSH